MISAGTDELNVSVTPSQMFADTAIIETSSKAELKNKNF